MDLYESVREIEPNGVANLDPRSMVGTFYQEISMHCYIQDKENGVLWFKRRRLFRVLHYKCMEADFDPNGMVCRLYLGD